MHDIIFFYSWLLQGNCVVLHYNSVVWTAYIWYLIAIFFFKASKTGRVWRYCQQNNYRTKNRPVGQKWLVQKNKDCWHHHSIPQERHLNLFAVCVGSQSILKWFTFGYILKALKILQQIFLRTNIAVTQTQYPQLIRKWLPGSISINPLSGLYLNGGGCGVISGWTEA